MSRNWVESFFGLINIVDITWPSTVSQVSMIPCLKKSSISVSMITCSTGENRHSRLVPVPKFCDIGVDSNSITQFVIHCKMNGSEVIVVHSFTQFFNWPAWNGFWASTIAYILFKSLTCELLFNGGRTWDSPVALAWVCGGRFWPPKKVEILWIGCQ